MLATFPYESNGRFINSWIQMSLRVGICMSYSNLWLGTYLEDAAKGKIAFINSRETIYSVIIFYQFYLFSSEIHVRVPHPLIFLLPSVSISSAPWIQFVNVSLYTASWITYIVWVCFINLHRPFDLILYLSTNSSVII